MDRHLKKGNRNISNIGKHFVVFTDLDGTLLDENYSPGNALNLLNKIKNKIPVIFCSGKTRAEQEVYLKKFEINHPFIVEDGSAIYIPKGYFPERTGEIYKGYERIILGDKYENIIKDIKKIQKRYKIKGYADLSIEEVAKITGLDLSSAKLAKEREFSETVVEADEEAIEILKDKYNVVIGGRFIHVFGKNADKGKAVKILADLYKKYFNKNIITIGIGNYYTDEPMLRACSIKALVKNPDGGWADIKIPDLFKADGIGPEGWICVIKKFIIFDYEEK